MPSSSPWVLTNNDGDSVHQLEWEVQEAGTTLVSINAPCGGAHNLSRAVGGLGLNTQFRPAGNARVSCLIKAGSGDVCRISVWAFYLANVLYEKTYESE